jgi:hypothetical protein
MAFQSVNHKPAVIAIAASARRDRITKEGQLLARLNDRPGFPGECRGEKAQEHEQDGQIFHIGCSGWHFRA